MNYQSIIDRYYPEADALRQLLVGHSRQVADRCLLLAGRHPELPFDRAFLEEAAMLHDIGIRWCHAPGIFCLGTEHYIRHGLLGGQLLRREGLERHARVCERHTGTGITRKQIEQQGLPLPLDGVYVPETLEEQLICYADKFFSKSHPDRVLTVEQAAKSLEKFGRDGVEIFLKWAEKFE